MKLKVAYMSHFSDLKMGGQRSMTFLIENLNRDLIEPIAIMPEKGELSEKLESIDCRCFFSPVTKLKPRNWRKYHPTFKSLQEILLKEKPNIIHADNDADVFFASLVKKKIDAKLIWHIRWTHPATRDFLLERIIDGAIAVSDGAGKRLSQKFRNTDKYKTIYNGVDTTEFVPALDRSEAKRSLGITTDRPVLIFVGVLKDGKGVLDIADAMGILKQNDKKVPKVLMIGSKGNENVYNSLINKIKQNNLHDDIELFGQKDEIYKWMQAADALMIPSHEGNEGMPRVAVEAMSCGTPVIGTNISGTNEAITNDSGLLVEEKQPQELADAIDMLMNDNNLLNKLSIGARERAVKNFDIKIHTKNVMAFYDKILNK